MQGESGDLHIIDEDDREDDEITDNYTHAKRFLLCVKCLMGPGTA